METPIPSRLNMAAEELLLKKKWGWALTGSTGFLGCTILKLLLASPRVRHVLYLNKHFYAYSSYITNKISNINE